MIFDTQEVSPEAKRKKDVDKEVAHVTQLIDVRFVNES